MQTVFRYCSHCKENKPISEHHDSALDAGRRRCKACVSKANHENYLKRQSRKKIKATAKAENEESQPRSPAWTFPAMPEVLKSCYWAFCR